MATKKEVEDAELLWLACFQEEMRLTRELSEALKDSTEAVLRYTALRMTQLGERDDDH